MIKKCNSLSYPWTLDLSIVPKGYFWQILDVEKGKHTSFGVTT